MSFREDQRGESTPGSRAGHADFLTVKASAPYPRCSDPIDPSPDREGVMASLADTVAQVGSRLGLKSVPDKKLAYGAREIPGVIPANSILDFEVELLKVTR